MKCDAVGLRAGAATSLLAVAWIFVGAAPRLASAQTTEVYVEAGGSRIQPPSGVDGEAAGFLVGGLRAGRYGRLGTGVWGSVLFGSPLDATTGGDFLSGEVGGAAWRRLARGWSTGLEARAFGFRVAQPFSYQAGGAEGTWALRYRSGPLSVRLNALGGFGRSRVSVSTEVQRMRRQMLVTQVLVDDLWRYGTELEVLFGQGPLSAGVAGGAHRSAGGTFRSIGARVVAGGHFGALELRVDRWSTPEGNLNTGGLAFHLPLGGWVLRGVGGRPEPDPLLLAEPGRQATGVLVGRRIYRKTAEPSRRYLYRLVDESEAGARVRFSVQAPDPGSANVQLLGDFTLWEPVAMSAGQGHWTVTVDVPPGTHHFGFLVDGAWYLPDDAADAVPDEWGRRSATLVIEGEAGS